MRDLMECQAEVFRRSEKRIKARAQRRKHILMTCVPLVFCVSLFFAFLPTWMPANNKAEPEDFMQSNGEVMLPEDAGLMGDAESLLCVYAKVDVTGDNISRSYTKASEVLDIWNQLNACMGGKPESVPPADEETRGDDDLTGTITDNIYGKLDGVSDAGKPYAITLTTHEGKITSYELLGNSLLDVAQDKTYELTPEQVNGLHKLLGIQ